MQQVHAFISFSVYKQNNPMSKSQYEIGEVVPAFHYDVLIWEYNMEARMGNSLFS